MAVPAWLDPRRRPGAREGPRASGRHGSGEGSLRSEAIANPGGARPATTAREDQLPQPDPRRAAVPAALLE